VADDSSAPGFHGRPVALTLAPGLSSAAPISVGRRVYFDTNRAVRETFATAGYPAPEQLVLVRRG